MSAPSQPHEEIRQLLRRHVPEIATGTVEIMSVARADDRRSCIVVRSHDPKVSAVQACSGEKGERLKAVAAEMGGEYLTLIQWHAAAEQIIADAFSHPGVRVVYDPRTRQTTVTIDAAARKLFLGGMPDRMVPVFEELTGLVSELTGWKISLARTGMGRAALSSTRR